MINRQEQSKVAYKILETPEYKSLYKCRVLLSFCIRNTTLDLPGVAIIMKESPYAQND